MGAKTRRTKKSPYRDELSVSTGGQANGHTGSSMNNTELRRKFPASQDSGQVTANLMSRESFSLDDEVPKTPSVNNHGFWELPRQDQRNFMLLVLLYFLQGVPMGLASGSVPFLLKEHLSFGEIGVFSLASYPYSLKLFWSPIVDAVWSPKLGRRKSWILPIQLMSGFGMLWLGSMIEDLMLTTGKPGGPSIWSFTGWWFFLVFMCATQDIAVDGWALTLLTPGNVSYASTAQTVGLTAGQFLSYTVFLAFNSKDFANKYFRSTPSEEGLMSLGGYLTFWGWAYIAITIGLALLKKEEKTKNEDGIWDVYKIMWRVLKLRNIQTIIIVHLISKIGFQANDGVTNLKLLEKGFGKENMALTVLIDFPFEIGLGYYAGKWSQEYTPMRLWCWGFVGRLIAAVFAQFTVSIFPADGVQPWYLLLVIGEHVFSTFTQTVMFVAVSAFHARVADPVIGGTYMTLLATVSNLGGTFPKYFVLRLVDAFTQATCRPPAEKLDSSMLKSPLVTEAFSCAIQAERERCEGGGGTCETLHDGFYIVNVLCVIVGLLTFTMYIRKKVIILQDLPLRAWRLAAPGEKVDKKRTKNKTTKE
ncbi:acetyl-CoA transporter 1 [Biscogniauxia marginata]|nr:acetyl-CoA transporter 1 [Biscogniauxia marginata]